MARTVDTFGTGTQAAVFGGTTVIDFCNQLRGQLIVDGHEWHGREGMGAFLRRGPCGTL